MDIRIKLFKIAIIIAFYDGIIIPVTSIAQNTGGTLFKDSVYAGYLVTQNVVYGSNVDYLGNNVQLTMDIYQPNTSDAIKRPLIIFAHGGGFVTGDKTEGSIVLLCTEFAKRGYITASINYRVGIPQPGDTIQFTQAIYRATQDGRAAVRYFKGNADNYCIDTNIIFFGGTSAGSATALPVAFWQQDHVPSYINVSQMGLLDNASNSYNFSSKINAVINCWGAIIDSTIFNEDPHTPVISFVGSNDPVIPPYDGYYTATKSPVFIYGSEFIDRKLGELGDLHQLKVFAGAGHGFPGGSPDWDTTLTMASDFLYNNFLAEYHPQPCSSTGQNNNSNVVQVNIWQNVNELEIQNNSILNLLETKIFNMNGQLVLTVPTQLLPNQIINVDASNLLSGVYIAQFVMQGGQMQTKKVMVIY